MVAGSRITLSDRLLLEDALNLSTLKGLVRFLKFIFRGTFIIEIIGAICYSFVFVPDFGLIKGLWFSIFHAVSAFCNAGIDLLGANSLEPYISNPWINFVTMFLIVSGGIGFIVWMDLKAAIKNYFQNKISVKKSLQKLRLHTKITLITTAILILGGALLIFVLVTDDLTEDGAEYTVYKRQLEGVDQRINKVSILEDTRLTFHYRCDRIADPVVQRQVGQRVVALPEHKGLEDQQCDRHDDAENKEQEQHGRDQQLMLAQTDRGGTAALAANGGVGLARADQLLVDEYRDRSDADHDECHGKRGLGILGLAVHVQLAGQGVVLPRNRFLSIPIPI